jgi:ribosomal protein S18 acetylase RimI-like enzyme
VQSRLTAGAQAKTRGRGYNVYVYLQALTMHFNDSHLNIRPETAQDADFLAALYRSTREDLLLSGLPEAMLENIIAMQFRAQQSGYRAQFPDAEHSILEKHGAPIGCIVCNRDSGEIRLVNIALLPHERNRGFGSRLLYALQAEAAAAGKALTLSVSTQNMRARNLYASCGFQVVHEDGAYAEMIWRPSAGVVMAMA